MVSLSKSRLTLYMKCPAKYKAVYIDGERKETEAMRRGKKIHQFIENAYDKGWFYIDTDTNTPYPMVRANGQSVPQQMRQYKEYLQLFQKYENKRLERTYTMYPEQWKDYFYPVTQEKKAEIYVDGHRIVGYPDAVYRIDDGYEVVDWKSGYSHSKHYTPKTREVEMNVYAMLLRQDERFRYDIKRGTFVHLKDQAELPFKITDNSLKRVRKVISRIADFIEHEKFECKCNGTYDH